MNYETKTEKRLSELREERDALNEKLRKKELFSRAQLRVFIVRRNWIVGCLMRNDAA